MPHTAFLFSLALSIFLSCESQASELANGFQRLFDSVEGLKSQNEVCHQVTERADLACSAMNDRRNGAEAVRDFNSSVTLADMQCNSRLPQLSSRVQAQQEQLRVSIERMEEELRQAKEKYAQVAELADADRYIARQRRAALAAALKRCPKYK